MDEVIRTDVNRLFSEIDVFFYDRKADKVIMKRYRFASIIDGVRI